MKPSQRLQRIRAAIMQSTPNAAVKGNASGFHDRRKYSKQDRREHRREEESWKLGGVEIRTKVQ